MRRTAVGDVIAGAYRLEREVGEGAMGVVFEATQIALKRRVAVKILHAQYSALETARKRFEREARVAAALDHRCAVQVIDFGRDGDTLYLVMEFLDGAPLRELVDEDLPKLPRATALAIAVQIADVLAAAHRLNLVHRDIKPENVMIEAMDEAGPRLRVVDFGLAFIADTNAGSIGRLTNEDVLGGTPQYMSPEQAEGKPIGPAADVYALGCMIYEMVAGSTPFSGAVAELLMRHVYVPPVPLRECVPEEEVPVELDELVLEMLSKSAAHRPTAEAVRERLLLVGRYRDTAAVKEQRRGGLVASGTSTPDGEAAAPARLELSVSGACPEELRLELLASGVDARQRVGDEEAMPAGGAVFAPGADIETVRALSARGCAVIADVAAGDLERAIELLRAGAVDAVVRPVRADDLARKLRRIERRRARLALVTSSPAAEGRPKS